MKLGLPLAIILAAIAWIVMIGIPIWIAFVVAGGIIALAAVAGGAERASS